MQDESIPLGLCRCGCDERTTVPAKTHTRLGRFKGVPMKYIRGHNTRERWAGLIDYEVDAATGCWIWQRNLDKRHGYGLCMSDGKQRLAHRIYYERFKGPIPQGAHGLDHLCRNRACVNPDHLQPVSNATNSRRGAKTKLTWDDVRAIRASTDSYRALGRRYGVGAPCISNIKNNKRWVEGLEKEW